MTLKELIEQAQERAKKNPAYHTEQAKRMREAYQDFVKKLKEKRDGN